jgi:hypothetical protein
MARVSASFVEETLWPEFVELDRLLAEHLDEVTDRIIRESIYEGSEDLEVRPSHQALTG